VGLVIVIGRATPPRQEAERRQQQGGSWEVGGCTRVKTMSPSLLDFLLEARCSAILRLSCDAFLSHESQSILIEILFWSILFLLYATPASNFFRALLSQKAASFWKGPIKDRCGVVAANAQDDCILVLTNALHHGAAGLLCAWGARTKDANLWRHGYLLEVGFEMADLVAMVIPTYPYRWDNVKKDIQIATFFHHLPGIFFPGLLLRNSSLYQNEHLQEISIWLLLGASFSLFSIFLIYTRDANTQMVQTSFLFFANFFFFLYCRFYVFIKESRQLIHDIEADKEVEGTIAAKCLYFYGGFICLFNFGMLADVIPKGYRMVLRTWDGVTPLDDDTVEVPPAREHRLKYELNRIKKRI
jgi:hypothetical protein